MVMRIRELREAAGLSRPELAQRMGVQSRDVVNWETEAVLPRCRQLHALALALGCSVGELFTQAS